MSEGMNKVLLLGNLGADPELRRTAGGLAVLRLRIATNESWLDKDHKPQGRVEWHTVTVWGARAEALARILTKGARVLVEGGIRTTSFEKEGQKHYRTEIHARDLFLTGRRPQGSAGDEAIEPERDDAAAARARTVATAGARAPALAEELPF
jgi:single-strand DNA-binding protein